MAQRITIMLEDNFQKKIRMLQAKKIKESNKSVSFSQVLNMILEEGLKKF